MDDASYRGFQAHEQTTRRKQTRKRPAEKNKLHAGCINTRLQTLCMYSVVPGILYISLQRRVQGGEAGKREGLNGKIGVRCVKQKGRVSGACGLRSRMWLCWFVVCGLWFVDLRVCDLMFDFCISFEL